MPNKAQADIVLNLDAAIGNSEDDDVNQMQEPFVNKSIEAIFENQLSNIDYEESKESFDDLNRPRNNFFIKEIKNVSQHSADGRRT